MQRRQEFYEEKQVQSYDSDICDISRDYNVELETLYRTF